MSERGEKGAILRNQGTTLSQKPKNSERKKMGMASLFSIKLLAIAAVVVVLFTSTNALPVPISVRTGKGAKCSPENLDLFYELSLKLDASSKEGDLLPVRSAPTLSKTHTRLVDLFSSLLICRLFAGYLRDSIRAARCSRVSLICGWRYGSCCGPS